MSTQPASASGAGRRPQPLRVDARFLRVYLNDHLAVSEGIGALVARMLQSQRWSIQRPQLQRLAGALEHDRTDLESVLHVRSLKPNPLKRLAVVVGERAGRLKGNGRVLRASPLAKLVELEGLMLGLSACMAPWRTLLELDVEPERARAALERLDRSYADFEPLLPDVRAGAFAD